MRTTVRLDEEVLRRAKRAALERGTTLAAVIEDALRAALALRERPRAGQPPRLPTFRGDGLQPGVDLDDTAALLELMDQPPARA